jgi:hypothetical protein
MDVSPSLEAITCSVTRGFLSILWNPKVHYCVQNSPPLFLILSQTNQVRTNPPHSISLRSILVLSSHVFLVVSFLLAFPPKRFMHSCFHMRATYPTYLIILQCIPKSQRKTISDYRIYWGTRGSVVG